MCGCIWSLQSRWCQASLQLHAAPLPRWFRCQHCEGLSLPATSGIPPLAMALQGDPHMLCWSLLCLPGGWDAGTPHCHMVGMLPWGRSRLDDSKKTCPVKPVPCSAHSWAICKLGDSGKPDSQCLLSPRENVENKVPRDPLSTRPIHPWQKVGTTVFVHYVASCGPSSLGNKVINSPDRFLSEKKMKVFRTQASETA